MGASEPCGSRLTTLTHQWHSLKWKAQTCGNPKHCRRDLCEVSRPKDALCLVVTRWLDPQTDALSCFESRGLDVITSIRVRAVHAEQIDRCTVNRFGVGPVPIRPTRLHREHHGAIYCGPILHLHPKEQTLAIRYDIERFVLGHGQKDRPAFARQVGHCLDDAQVPLFFVW
jgi:hypothetical protein